MYYTTYMSLLLKLTVERIAKMTNANRQHLLKNGKHLCSCRFCLISFVTFRNYDSPHSSHCQTCRVGIDDQKWHLCIRIAQLGQCASSLALKFRGYWILAMWQISKKNTEVTYPQGVGFPACQVLPEWKLSPTWDGVREMLSKMVDASSHPKVWADPSHHWTTGLVDWWIFR